MAQNNPSHSSFRNLRLDTRHQTRDAAASPRDSLSKSAPPTSLDGGGLGPAQSLSTLSSSDLLNSLCIDDDDDEDDDGNVFVAGGLLQDSGSAQGYPPYETNHSFAVALNRIPSRQRGTSVSFNSHATLDNGTQHSLKDPLPDVGSARRRTRDTYPPRSAEGDSSATDVHVEGSPRINPFTGEPARRRTRRSDMARLDKIESGREYDVPSLSSGITASPIADEVTTPLSTSMGASIRLPAHAVNSPNLSPSVASEPWPMSKRDSGRSRMSSRPVSLRNTSRRSSRMSNSTSMSPASAFLSLWGRESATSMAAPDPDDEGQTIGLDNEYVIGRQIGCGGFSVVKELHSMSDQGEKIRQAIKIVRKAIPNVSEKEIDKQQQGIEHEIKIWRYLHNEHILSLHSVYDTDFATFCVVDLVEGGTLFDLVRKSRSTPSRGLDGEIAKRYAHQLASALRYLHEDIRIVHRDVKLENCMLSLPKPDANTLDGDLKLCDFGLADFIGSDMFDSLESLDLDDPEPVSAASIIGTLQYAAPESFAAAKPLRQPSTDIWAYGVCVYAMVTGDLPFRHSLQHKVVQMIKDGVWDREAVKKAPAAQEDPEPLLELLDGCLELDSSMRWTISDVLACTWFDGTQSTEGEAWQML